MLVQASPARTVTGRLSRGSSWVRNRCSAAARSSPPTSTGYACAASDLTASDVTAGSDQIGHVQQREHPEYRGSDTYAAARLQTLPRVAFRDLRLTDHSTHRSATPAQRAFLPD